MKKNARLVHRRRGARRRSKLKLLFQLVASLIFLGTAALLSAGIVQVVERPVAPWKTGEQVPPIAEAAPLAVDPSDGAMEIAEVERVELAGTIDPEQARFLARETRPEDLGETAAPRAGNGAVELRASR